MGWIDLLGQLVITLGTVGVAWIGLKKTLAEQSKKIDSATEAARAAEAHSHKTEQSINNRPTSMSDRVDKLAKGNEAVLKELKGLKGTLDEHGRDIRGLRTDHKLTRNDIGSLRGVDRAGREETQALRKDFEDHVNETRPMMPMLAELHRKYIGRRGQPPISPTE